MSKTKLMLFMLACLFLANNCVANKLSEYGLKKFGAYWTETSREELLLIELNQLGLTPEESQDVFKYLNGELSREDFGAEYLQESRDHRLFYEILVEVKEADFVTSPGWPTLPANDYRYNIYKSAIEMVRYIMTKEELPILAEYVDHQDANAIRQYMTSQAPPEEKTLLMEQIDEMLIQPELDHELIGYAIVAYLNQNETDCDFINTLYRDYIPNFQERYEEDLQFVYFLDMLKFYDGRAYVQCVLDIIDSYRKEHGPSSSRVQQAITSYLYTLRNHRLVIDYVKRTMLTKVDHVGEDIPGLLFVFVNGESHIDSERSQRFVRRLTERYNLYLTILNH